MTLLTPRNTIISKLIYLMNCTRPCRITSGIINKKHSWVSLACLYTPSLSSGLTAGSPKYYPQNCNSQAFHTLLLHCIIYESLLDFSSVRCGGVDVATVNCSISSTRENCHCGIEITTVDFWTASGVWIGTRCTVWLGQQSWFNLLWSRVIHWIRWHWFRRTEESPHAVLMTANNSSVL